MDDTIRAQLAGNPVAPVHVVASRTPSRVFLAVACILGYGSTLFVTPGYS